MTISTAVLQRIDTACTGLIEARDDLHHQLRALQREQGRNAPKPQDDERFKEALLSFLQSIATIALSQIPPRDGIAVAFGEGRYTGGLSPTALRQVRDAMVALEYVVVGKWSHNKDDRNKGRFTRIRHTEKLTLLLRSYGVRLADVAKPPVDVVRLSRPKTDVMPGEIAASGEVVRRYNAYIAEFDLSLPQEGWHDLFHLVIKGGSNGKGDRLDRGYSDGRIYLWRGFAEDYSRGGRCYGQVQQNMPKSIRKRLLINGKATIELDFSRIHPTIIFAEKGIALDLDPYAVPGYEGMEEAGKETFNRLLNSRRKIRFRSREDRQWFSDKFSFNDYRDAMIAHLSAISDTFQKDYGARLQKRDSELALNVIQRCMDSGLPVYPVHDSFITTIDNRSELEHIMREEFFDMFGVHCLIK